jgi:soluble lytic murein transglycosylase-like protein
MVKDEFFDDICIEITDSINFCSAFYNLDPELIASIIYQESVQGASHIQKAVIAMRYEHDFYFRYISPLELGDPAEEILRSTSFGLMQVMGQTAIDYKLIEVGNIEKLLNIRVNVGTGCAIFKRKMGEGKSDEARIFRALRLYNGSLGNPLTEAYANSVLNHKRNESYKLFYRG